MAVALLRSPEGLTRQRVRSTFVLMEVETLGVARSLGWKVHMRCANGYREGTRSMRRCVYRKQLDLETLVCACTTTVAILPQKLKLWPSHGRSSWLSSSGSSLIFLINEREAEARQTSAQWFPAARRGTYSSSRSLNAGRESQSQS